MLAERRCVEKLVSRVTTPRGGEPAAFPRPLDGGLEHRPAADSVTVTIKCAAATFAAARRTVADVGSLSPGTPAARGSRPDQPRPCATKSLEADLWRCRPAQERAVEDPAAVAAVERDAKLGSGSRHRPAPPGAGASVGDRPPARSRHGEAEGAAESQWRSRIRARFRARMTPWRGPHWGAPPRPPSPSLLP
jgi:hypothetical protein